MAQLHGKRESDPLPPVLEPGSPIAAGPSRTSGYNRRIFYDSNSATLIERRYKYARGPSRTGECDRRYNQQDGQSREFHRFILPNGPLSEQTAGSISGSFS